jgi:hypothetical protein
VPGSFDCEMKVAESAYDNLVPEKVKDVIPEGSEVGRK